MIQIRPQMRILLAIKPVDFRKGIDGLAAVSRRPALRHEKERETSGLNTRFPSERDPGAPACCRLAGAALPKPTTGRRSDPPVSTPRKGT